MTVRVLEAGLLSTIQGNPRTGFRHLGVPASGPADPLSMALANRLVGNAASVPALETTLTGVTLEFAADTAVAIAGAAAPCLLNGDPVGLHTTVPVRCGDVLVVGAAQKGVRNYVAFSGGLQADEFLGSTSTYVPAGLGGFRGRGLQKGDELLLSERRDCALLQTPAGFRFPISHRWALRTCRSCETHELRHPADLFDRKLKISKRSDRMGIALEGGSFTTESLAGMASSPVFPGIVQCPGDGSLFLMSVDAQTSGGYPRVAKLARLDMHPLGQLRPGDSLSLIERSEADAARELHEKHAYWKEWLPDIDRVI